MFWGASSRFAIKVIIKCANKILHWQIVSYITFLAFPPLCTHTVKCLHTERLPQLKLTRKGGKTWILPAEDNLCKELRILQWSSNKWLQKYHLTSLPAAFGGNKIDAEGLGSRPRKWINKSLNSWKSDWSKCYQGGLRWENGINVFGSRKGGNLIIQQWMAKRTENKEGICRIPHSYFHLAFHPKEAQGG